MFKNKTEMKIEELPPLIFEQKDKALDSNIQIVGNYLKLLESGQISEKDLIIDKVSLSRDDIEITLNRDLFKGDTYMNAKFLDEEECNRLIMGLIKDKLGIKFPNYYQINSFINVLSGQLRNFSMNIGLTAAYLIQSELALNRKDIRKLREILVNSFIQNTIHFTQGAFDKILTAQQETYNVGIEQGNYDEDQQEEVAIKALSNPGDIISCDKIDPALVFFHEGEGQEFTIITRENPNKNEYNKLLQLRQTFVDLQNQFYDLLHQTEKIEQVPKELKHYYKFKHKQFLEEIKSILSLKNQVYRKDQEKYKDDPDLKYLKSIEEIVGEYVFTADNFIKMVLILLRIRANIPVIMMGETGCGKTSLIRKLSELINNGEGKMEILNIHAGITDEEIVKFLFEEKIIDGKKYDSLIDKAEKLREQEEETEKKYIAKGQKYFKKKLWVFLDEINTCNCMGLICEMMTKHSCQGKKLPENIFFIGACNPYRYGKKSEENYALKVDGTKEKKLVYTVNPLPFSLLNFVFNFGNLTPQDEESYINNMVVSPIENFFWKEIEANNKDNKEFVRQNWDKYITKEDADLCEKLKKIASNAIISAQNYVRQKK
jgi:MoxR-like ATPase